MQTNLPDCWKNAPKSIKMYRSSKFSPAAGILPRLVCKNSYRIAPGLQKGSRTSLLDPYLAVSEFNFHCPLVILDNFKIVVYNMIKALIICNLMLMARFMCVEVTLCTGFGDGGIYILRVRWREAPPSELRKKS